jgi:hypothetical protein
MGRKFAERLNARERGRLKKAKKALGGVFGSHDGPKVVSRIVR